MTKKQDLTLLYRIARQYYIDRIPQTQIADQAEDGDHHDGAEKQEEER